MRQTFHFVLIALLNAPWIGAAHAWVAAGSCTAPCSLRKVNSSELPDLPPEGDVASLTLAVRRQLDQCAKQDEQETFVFGERTVTRKEWCLKLGNALLQLAVEEKTMARVWERARTEFEWYQSVGDDGRGSVLFTGYHFPSLPARTTPDARFKYPLYRQPNDLVRVMENGQLVWRRKTADQQYVPYFTRAEIDGGGALAGQGLEVGYVADPLDAAIFQIEGAGALLFPGPQGTERRVILNYAAQNGHPYVGIAQILRDQGVASEFLTVPGMRRYFATNPEALTPVLNQNPSYVFFREGLEGPYGKEVLLTPGHSIAIDPSAFPYGALTFFKAQRPTQDGSAFVDFSRLALTQDTGGAIRGPGRVDIYWGEDAYAETASGLMSSRGTLFLAVPR